MNTPNYKTVLELTPVDAVSRNDVVEVVQGGVSKQMTVGELLGPRLIELDTAEAISDNDYVRIFQDGVEYKIARTALIKFARYDVAYAAEADPAQPLDLNVSQVFSIDNSASSAKTLTFSNTPAAGRCATHVIEVKGKAGTINWPGNIKWNDNTPPVLGVDTTVVILLFLGSGTVMGSQGATS